MRFADFNITNTTTKLFGLDIVDGIAPDPFLQFRFPDSWEYEQSAEGLLIRCATNDTLVECDLNLFTASSENEKVSLAHNADVASYGGAGVGVFLFKDNNGGTIITAEHCWVHKKPDFAVARKVGKLTWPLRMQIDPKLTIIAGNTIV